MWHQAALCALPFSPPLSLSFSLSLFLFLSLLLHRCPILAILRLAVPIAKSSCHFLRDNVLSSSFIILYLLSLLFFFVDACCSGRVGFSGVGLFFSFYSSSCTLLQLRFTRQRLMQNDCPVGSGWLSEGWAKSAKCFLSMSYSPCLVLPFPSLPLPSFLRHET